MTEKNNLDIGEVPYPTPLPPPRAVAKRPDETSGLLIEARFKIFDPETNEVKVEGRA